MTTWFYISQQSGSDDENISKYAEHAKDRRFYVYEGEDDVMAIIVYDVTTKSFYIINLNRGYLFKKYMHNITNSVWSNSSLKWVKGLIKHLRA